MLLAIRFLLFPRRPDQGFHVVQVPLQRSPPGPCQPVFRFWQPSIKGFRAHDIVRLFQLSRVDAQISIRSLKQCLQFVECQRAVHRQRADNAQPDAFVNQSVKIRRNRLTRLLAHRRDRILALTRTWNALLRSYRRLSHFITPRSAVRSRHRTRSAQVQSRPP
jgi:hypothetical protein